MSDPSRDGDPDYRFSLAAERTYLAYVRTGIALAAAGVAVGTGLPHAGASGLRRGLGVVLVILGAGVLVFARVRLAAVIRAMRTGQPLPALRFGTAVTVVLVAVAVVAAVVVIVA